ncbi:uncharacterized protein [Polyergus mexicanus]|uniref:uncharacterized protein n=1 Tax=Polyergus mexicanus TaxID=615972 RepID=UPI0038B43FBF
MAHKDEIQHQIMKKVNPAFIALSETRLTAEIEDSEVNVPGYKNLVLRIIEFNIDEFIKLVENKLEKNQDMNISVRAKKFVDSIVNALDATAPRKNFRIPRIWEGKKWFSDEIREAAAKRDEAYRKALYADTEQNWLQFKIERNTVVKLIKTKKKEYYENMIDLNKENPTSMWKTLKEIIRGEPGEHLEEIVMGLPKKKGTEEGITSDILKAAFCVIKEEFVDIINNSLKEGCCPKSWKTSTIIPIPKIEKARKAKHQSGFRKQYSCETAIQTVIDEWKLIVSEAKMVGVIFMDLKRAFETIDRERLLEKLYQYGIRGMVIEWLRSYLKDRTQQVQFNNKWSKLMTTEYGVPQGSRNIDIKLIKPIVSLCPAFDIQYCNQSHLNTVMLRGYDTSNKSVRS